ncbi:MAG TPA: undecaprenyl-diphosphate phosphatase, partial [Proteobacteria bacterium]|nr:undecaprenyl-diphosphate phosphatase [Pseudomonadota bacterium]
MLEALVLGIVQGLTEFLPISSSGHLALFGHLFGEGLGGSLSFVVAVHLGTLAAVCWVFRRDVLNVLTELPALVRPGGWRRSLGSEPFRLAVCVLVVSAITGLAGFALRDRIESAFGSLLAVGIAFFCTGILLSLTRLARTRDVGVFALGILVGVAQSVALMPGVSRSGTTIGAAMLAGA